ncbi:MAG: hypothetical protein ACMXYF_00465 [Candidatus Woesearchaeota archaeon]
MTQLSTDIGDVFEKVVSRSLAHIIIKNLQRNGPEFITNKDPDFLCKTPDGNIFGLEAKTSFINYGAQIKDYQVESFQEKNYPVFYLIGFHMVPNLAKIWRTLKRPKRHLQRNFCLDSLYFCSCSVIDALFAKEFLIAKKARNLQLLYGAAPRNLATKYCGIKKRTLRQIIQNEHILRNNQHRNVREHYQLEDICVGQTQPLPFRIFNMNTQRLPIKYIVERKEQSYILYL